MASNAPQAEHGSPAASQALVVAEASDALASGGAPPPVPTAAARISALVATAMAELQGATKASLIKECHVAGLPATRRNTKRQLLDRLEAHLTAMAAATAACSFAARQRPAAPPALLGAPRGPARSGGQALAVVLGPPALPHAPGSTADDAPAGPPSSSRSPSPSTPPGKRPRADAPSSPPGDPMPGLPPSTQAPPLQPPVPCAAAGRRVPYLPDPDAARRRSHAAASIRPARLDEVLDLQAEIRRRQVCLRGLPDSPSETTSSLEQAVDCVVARLVGRRGHVEEAWRVGRFAAGRPRPVIIKCRTVGDKVALLQSKGQLYALDCPGDLQGLRLYHDLSAAQLTWKMQLKGAFERFLGAGVRAVWRRGYRLFAFLEGSWEEFVPLAALVP